LNDSELSPAAAKELRLLARRLAEEVLDDAESISDAEDDDSVVVGADDVEAAWSRLSLVPPKRSARISKAIQFIMITLSLAAVIFLVFDLTAPNLGPAPRAALVFATVGFFYVLVTVARSLRERLIIRAKVKPGLEKSADISVLKYVEQEPQPDPNYLDDTQEKRGLEQASTKRDEARDDERSRLVLIKTVREDEAPTSVLQFIEHVLRDQETSSRLSFLIWQGLLAIVVLVSVVAGLIYLGRHELTDGLSYFIAFGSALVLAVARVTLSVNRRARKRSMYESEPDTDESSELGTSTRSRLPTRRRRGSE